MATSKEILDLIERFERNLDAYKAGQYNKTQIRRKFFLEAKKPSIRLKGDPSPAFQLCLCAWTNPLASEEFRFKKIEL